MGGVGGRRGSRAQVLRLRIWSEDGGSLFTELQAEAQVTRAIGSGVTVSGGARH